MHGPESPREKASLKKSDEGRGHGWEVAIKLGETLEHDGGRADEEK